MKTSRMLAVPALAAVSLLALTGCFQLPPAGGSGSTGGTGGTTETEGGSTGSEGGAVDLTDTSWTGTDAAGNEMDLVLEADGTVLLNDWNGDQYDSAGDTWEVSGDQITIFIDDIQEIGSLTYTGTAAEGTMELSGTDASDQGGYDLTLTQG